MPRTLFVLPATRGLLKGVHGEFQGRVMELECGGPLLQLRDDVVAQGVNAKVFPKTLTHAADTREGPGVDPKLLREKLPQEPV